MKIKIIYVLSIVFLGISVLGGIMVLCSLLTEDSIRTILQTVGISTLLGSYGISALLDFFFKKITADSMRNKREKRDI